MAYVRTVKTASGATAVQIVWSSSKGSRRIDHLGSAHTSAEVEALKAAGRQRIDAGQGVLDLGIEASATVSGGGLPQIVGSRAGLLIDAITDVYAHLGLVDAVDDEVFFQLVAARIIEPTSKEDSLRVLDEMGIEPVSYPTIKRRLPGYATEVFRHNIARACANAANIGPGALILYDVSTLYFETDKADGFREPGFSKERRLEPQITIGLLTDATGFPLTVRAFAGNKAETATMVPVLREFMAAHQLSSITVVADAGMISEANEKAFHAAGLGYIIGARLPHVPYQIEAWSRAHPGQDLPDGLTLTQPWPAAAGSKARGVPDRAVHYQYRYDRARRTLRGIDEQVRKAQAAVDGKTAIKRNRFVKLTGGNKTVNRELEAKARALAGWKSYRTNQTGQSAATIIDAYHRLWHVEKAFRMSKHDLKARPIYHRKQESIEAHLTVVLAALAVSHRIETITGWSIKKFVRAARRYRTVDIKIGEHILTAEHPPPADLADAIARIHAATSAH